MTAIRKLFDSLRFNKAMLQSRHYIFFSGREIPSKSSDNSISKAWHILMRVVTVGLVLPFSILPRLDLSNSHKYANSAADILFASRNSLILLPSCLKNCKSSTRQICEKRIFYMWSILTISGFMLNLNISYRETELLQVVLTPKPKA
jgi:hypothetical protein